MKLLITGGDSFTGRHLVPKALAQNHDVYTLKSNLKDFNALKKEINSIQPEGVIHLAGISSVDQSNLAEFYEVNTIGTLYLLESLLNLTNIPKKVLLASSANIYGNVKHSPIYESELASPINHYGISKLAMEGLVKIYQEKLPINIVRCFNYTGQGQPEEFLIPKLIYHFKNRLPSIELGNLDVRREFNDVRMVADVYLSLLLNYESGEIYNLCSGKAYSINEIINVLKDLTGHSITIKINQDFVRKNELAVLCGEPKKLIHTIGPLPVYDIKETLQWMLDA